MIILGMSSANTGHKKEYVEGWGAFCFGGGGRGDNYLSVNLMDKQFLSLKWKLVLVEKKITH